MIGCALSKVKEACKLWQSRTSNSACISAKVAKSNIVNGLRQPKLFPSLESSITGIEGNTLLKKTSSAYLL